MAYYPKSQIKTGLYINKAGVLFLRNGESYTGPYYLTSTNQKYTGLSPSDTSQELFEKSITNPSSNTNKTVETQFTDPTVQNYLDLKSLSPTIRIIPSAVVVPPTKEDYQIGEFTRYFLKKINEFKYLEVTQDTYTKISQQNPQYLFEQYFPFSITWDIRGDKDQVYLTNKNIVLQTSQKYSLYSFPEYFRNNYLQFYKG